MKRKILTLLMAFTITLSFMPVLALPVMAQNNVRFYVQAKTGGTVQVAKTGSGDSQLLLVDENTKSEITNKSDFSVSDGETLSLTAQPKSGYTFDGWYTKWDSTSPTLVSKATTISRIVATETITASFTNGSTENTPTPIKSVSLTVTPPAAGLSAGSIYATAYVSVPSGSQYSLKYAQWTTYEATTDSSSSLPSFTDTFEAGKTYYMAVSLSANSGYFFSQSTDTTSFSVTGGQIHKEPSITNMTGAGSDSSTATMILSFTPASKNYIESISLTVTPPTVGDTASSSTAQSAVTVGTNDHCTLYVNNMNWYSEHPEYDAASPTKASFSGKFEAGKTYYTIATIVPDTDYWLYQGGERGTGSLATTATATGATIENDQNQLYVTTVTMTGCEYQFGDVTLAVTPTAALPVADLTEDKSVSHVVGNVHLTGAGGNDAGYNPEKKIYSHDYGNSDGVKYGTPKPKAVEDDLSSSVENSAYNQVNNAAQACKDAGKNGEYHMSTATTTSRAWDNRTYKTLSYTNSKWIDGDSKEYTIPDAKKPYESPKEGDKCIYASGDYGQETTYTVEANGYVSGFAITVTNDGNGSASSDVSERLSGKTVTLSASAKTGYEFDKWVVVSGGAAIESASNASVTFTMPKADVTVKATFKLNHSHKDNAAKTEQVDATCTTAGTEAYWKCSKCQKLFSDEECTNEISAPVAIPALGHSWGAWTVTTPATCEAAGAKTRTCTRDSSHKETAAIPALGHSWDAGKVTKEPTVTEAGVKTYTCTTCGAAKTEAIPALGKAANTMSAAAKNVKAKASKLKKKAQKKTAISVSGSKGAVSYQLTSAKKGKKSYKKYIKVNSSTGQVTLKKKLKKGTYKVKVNVTDPGDAATNGATQTVSFKVKVK